MVAAVALSAALLLGGCSDRDAAEQLAATNAAAARAEQAAQRAEAAAAKLDKAGQSTVVEADPGAAENADDAGLANDDEPASTEPDVKT